MSVNMQFVAINDVVFRNILANGINHEDVISQPLHDMENGLLSARKLKKDNDNEKRRKTLLYTSCLVNKLQANIMLLGLKSTHKSSDKGFDDFLCILRKLLPNHNELLEKNTWPGK
jgi:hypothetical protein